MKAIDGALDVSKKYSLVDCQYTGKYSYGLPSAVCENCSKVISNIAIVKDEAGTFYRIGLDCMETLVTMNPDEKHEAKKKIRKEIKFSKFMATKCKTIITEEMKDYTCYWAYESVVEKWERYWTYRGNYGEKTQALVKKYGVPVIVEPKKLQEVA